LMYKHRHNLKPRNPQKSNKNITIPKYNDKKNVAILRDLS